MKKLLKDIRIGQLVVVSEHPEAQVYTVAGIEGHNALLQWREGKSQARCTYDKFSLAKPTLEQIEYNISESGALVSRRDVEQWKGGL